MSRPTCSTCRHFWRLGTTSQGSECHVEAPRLMTMNTPQGIKFEGVWPPTREAFGCGQHQPLVELAS